MEYQHELQGLPYPRIGEGCTVDKQLLASHPHHHCPHCGAIANLHYRGGGSIDVDKEGCMGCDLCLNS